MKWNPNMDEAPRGEHHPYSEQGGAEFVLVYNGYHTGVAWHEYIDDEIGFSSHWWGEDSAPVLPVPTHWMPLPPPPTDEYERKGEAA